MIRNDIDNLISKQNLCLIPVSETDKSAFIKWGKMTLPNDLVQVFDWMQEFDTNAVAVKLGSASDNCLCLDIDTKHRKGFDAIIFSDLKSFYPDLWKVLRVEKTPSGGYHIFYKLDPLENCPRSSNIGNRHSTEEEMTEDVAAGKKPKKTRCFLEVKGEGGLTQIYPSPGYSLIQNEEIPVLSLEEHESLMSLCQVYNQVFKEERIRVTDKESDIYSENPFEHYDGSQEGSEILKEEGWKYYGKSGPYEYWTKPDSKERKVSGSFNTQKRLYTIFSSGVEVDTKSYGPSKLIGVLKFGDDKKQLFAYLVAKGYGKLKPGVEKGIIEKRIKNGGPLPPNVSEEGRILFETKREEYLQKHPYGTFWKEGKLGGVSISRDQFYDVAHQLGFRKHNNKPVRITGFIIENIIEDVFYDVMKEYIDDDEDLDVFDAYEAFLQNSGRFTISRLRELDRDLVLKSEKLISYKFFGNVYVKIDKEKIEVIDYLDSEGKDTLDGKLIWKSLIRDRDFEINDKYSEIEESSFKSLYYDYLSKAIGITDYLFQIIGYLSHDYRDEEGYFILATEMVENPKDGGGSGKNIFCNLFGLNTTYKTMPGAFVKKDNQLLQSWNFQRILCFADLPKNFNIDTFKEIITGNATKKELYVNEYEIEVEDMPKLLASTNFSYDNTDPGVKRRVRAIEFTEFFTLAGGVSKHYGRVMFPKGWKEIEYVYYDNIIIKSIQSFIKNECMIDARPLTQTGWVKQFEQKYKYLYDFFAENIDNWVTKHKVSNDDFRHDYDMYCKDNNINLNKRFAAKSMNDALTEYCHHINIDFEYKKGVWKDKGITTRGRIFGKIQEENKTGVVWDESEGEPF